MSIKLLNYEIFSDSKEELIKEVVKREKVNVVSGNPEILTLGLNNKEMFEVFTNENSIIIPDGVGTVIASKIINNPVKEKIAGIEVMEEVVKYCNENDKGIYLLGAKEEVIVECKKNLENKYGNLNILGYHNGYFDMDNCDYIVEEIKQKEPYALFIAMGAPRQENFIKKYIDILPCNIFMGVGGSFDVISGKINRAPKWMINLGLEWLYRTAKEPSRVKRLTVIPKFLLKVVKNK